MDSNRSPSPISKAASGSSKGAAPKSQGRSSPKPQDASFNSQKSNKVSAPNKSFVSNQSHQKEDQKQDEKQSTFMTQNQVVEKNSESSHTVNELLFPGGKVAKLIKLPNSKSRDLNFTELLKKCGITQPTPVILLSGFEGDIRSRLLVGVARAAFSTDAVIVDNGLKSGIEVACWRKKVKLLGVCPEEQIVYPTKASGGDRLGEVSAGHSHFFMLGSKGDKMRWDSGVLFKLDLMERIRKGRGGESYTCKGLCVLVGDSSAHLWEVEKVLKAGWTLLVLETSPIGRDIAGLLKGQQSSLPQSFQQALKAGKVFLFPEEGTAEHLASAVHLHLVLSL